MVPRGTVVALKRGRMSVNYVKQNLTKLPARRNFANYEKQESVSTQGLRFTMLLALLFTASSCRLHERFFTRSVGEFSLSVPGEK